eukprot:6421237-Prorocentrum_lima.AAC.1
MGFPIRGVQRPPRGARASSRWVLAHRSASWGHDPSIGPLKDPSVVLQPSVQHSRGNHRMLCTGAPCKLR